MLIREPHAGPQAEAIEVPLRRVRRIGAAMVWACRGLTLVMPLAWLAFWFWAGPESLAAQAHLSASSLMVPLQTWQRVASALVMALPLGLLLMGIGQARRCFGLFAQGEVFSSQTTSLLRRFAGWVAAAALAAILASTMVSVLLTVTHPPGMRQLAIGVGSNHVFTLFFAATVWLMAAVIGEGQALAEENRGFV
jgi:hypothetical protein